MQIGDKNCISVVQAVDEFLKTGKITKANPTILEDISILRQKYDRSFITEKPINLQNILNDGDRGIIYAIRKKETQIIDGVFEQSTDGHVFNFIKKDGVVLFKDGQSGRNAVLNNQLYPEGYQYMKTN